MFILRWNNGFERKLNQPLKWFKTHCLVSVNKCSLRQTVWWVRYLTDIVVNIRDIVIYELVHGYEWLCGRNTYNVAWLLRNFLLNTALKWENWIPVNYEKNLVQVICDFCVIVTSRGTVSFSNVSSAGE